MQLQQQYVTEPVDDNSNHGIATNKNVLGGGQASLTGPSFVDETNIDSVAELAEAGTR